MLGFSLNTLHQLYVHGLSYFWWHGELSPISSVTYIGIMLDYKLDFSEKMIGSAAGWIVILFRCESFLLWSLTLELCCKVNALVVNTCFLPLLWFVFTLCCWVLRLFRLQKRAVRVIFYLKGFQNCRSVFMSNNNTS